jgi:ribosomal protein L32E
LLADRKKKQFKRYLWDKKTRWNEVVRKTAGAESFYGINFVGIEPTVATPFCQIGETISSVMTSRLKNS